MPMEKGVNRNSTFEDAHLSELAAGAESEMARDAHKEEEVGEDGDDHSDDEEFALRFEGNMNPLDFTEDDAFGAQQYERFERLEYESLAERKRKAVEDPKNEEPTKKSRQGDVFGTSFEELMEAMIYGNRQKSRRKQKKRGRPKGSRNRVTPEITRMLGEGTIHYASGRYEEAINVLNEVIRLAPNLADTYHTLGLVYGEVGEKQKSMSFYMLAAVMKPKDSSLWKLLFSWSLEQGNTSQARYFLCKAIMADPEDIELRFHRASLYIELGNHEKAAKSYDEISQLWPQNVEAHKTAAKLYQTCGKVQRSIDILESYIKHQPTEADLSVVDLLAAICMQSNEYVKALEYIELAHSVYCSGRELPLHLTTKAGICHLHLGNMDKAEVLFGAYQFENVFKHADLITDIADSFKSLEHYESALAYYLMLERNLLHDNGNLHLKIAQCYLCLKDRKQAIQFFYKALNSLDDAVSARLALASLLLEEQKECEAIALLSPNNSELMLDTSCDQSKPWWLNEEIKLKLGNIYRAKNMVGEFVDVIFPLIHQSLVIKTTNKKFKAKKKLSTNVLVERAKVLDDLSTDNVFHGFRPTARASDLVKASRAKKLLRKKSTMKEEIKAKALAAGFDWQSEDSDDEPPRQTSRKPPVPQLLKDEGHHQLVIDLCNGLASLRRYEEALDIIKLTLRLASNKMSSVKKDELKTLGAQMAYKTTNPKCGYEIVCDIVQQRSYSMAAWNYFYKVISRFKIHHTRHSRLVLQRVQNMHKDCVPPIIISGHQFSLIGQHQAAAREYLEAYKLLPDSPLINLCVGTALVNLVLDARLQNKHQCLAQGLAFLYNNMKLCGDSQEAMYNIARAFHHVGLVSLAASYYENVLTNEKDFPIPKLPYDNPDLTVNQKSGYCNIKREAAYNLHLIYKNSGAFDLARQVLKEHCTL